MSARQIVPPVSLPVPLAQAISSAKAEGAGMDADIELDVRGIAGYVERKTRRALIEQTRRVTLHSFPDAVKLPGAPLMAVDSIKFIDRDGNQQTLDPQDYFVDSVSEPGYVMPAPGRAWPPTAERANAVEVQYRCGYGSDHTAVPPEIQTYILGKVEEKRAPGGNPNAKFLESLLDGFRVLV